MAAGTEGSLTSDHYRKLEDLLSLGKLENIVVAYVGMSDAKIAKLKEENNNVKVKIYSILKTWANTNQDNQVLVSILFLSIKQ